MGRVAEQAVEGLQRQRCKVCWSADGFNFDLPDTIWSAVVPVPLRSRVVCLACFDRLASEVGVEYVSHLRSIWFAGVTVGFELRLSR